MLLTVDSNLLVYTIDNRNPAKADHAVRVLAAVRERGGLIALQAINETFRVATGKLRWPPAVVAPYLRGLLNNFGTFGQTPETVLDALTLASARELSIWDANLVSAAQLAGCTHLLSEDMQDGRLYGRLEIVNPFSGDALSERAREILSL